MNIKISQFNQVNDIKADDLIPLVRQSPDNILEDKNKVIESADFKINSLNNIKDVNLNNPFGGESLIYSSTGQWSNGAPKPFVPANTLYVSPNGFDFPTNTLESDLIKPFATPRGAINYLRAKNYENWHIIVYAGTYADQYDLGYNVYWEFQFGAIIQNSTSNAMFEDKNSYVTRISGKGQFSQTGEASIVKFGMLSGTIIILSSYYLYSSATTKPMFDLYNYRAHTAQYIDIIQTQNTNQPVFKLNQDTILYLKNILQISTYQSNVINRGCLLESNGAARIDIRTVNFNSQGNCCVHKGGTDFLNYINCRFVYGQDDNGISDGQTDNGAGSGGDNYPATPANHAFYAIKFDGYILKRADRYPAFFGCLFITSDYWNTSNVNKKCIKSVTGAIGIQLLNSASNRDLDNVTNQTPGLFIVHPAISDTINF